MLAGLRRAVAEADALPSISQKPLGSRPCTPGATSASTNAPRDWKWPLASTSPTREDRRDRHAARLALGRDRVLRHAGEQRRVELVELGGRLEPRRDRVVALVLEGRGLAEPRPHRPPLARRQHDDAHVAVRAREDRVEPGLRPPAGRREGRGATHGRGAVGRVHGLRRRLEDREVDVIPASGLEAVPVGDERRPCGLDRGRLVRHPARRGRGSRPASPDRLRMPLIAAWTSRCPASRGSRRSGRSR